jgi:hypothetical protein
MKDDECFFCGEDGALDQHHIVPKRHGGSDKEDNLVTLCPTCHAKIERELYNRDFYEKITDSLRESWEPSGEVEYWTWVKSYKENPARFCHYISNALKKSEMVVLSTKHHDAHFRESAARIAHAFNEHYSNKQDIRKSELVKIFDLSPRYEVAVLDKDAQGHIDKAILRFDHDDLFWALKQANQERKKRA